MKRVRCKYCGVEHECTRMSNRERARHASRVSHASPLMAGGLDERIVTGERPAPGAHHEQKPSCPMVSCKLPMPHLHEMHGPARPPVEIAKSPVANADARGSSVQSQAGAQSAGTADERVKALKERAMAEYVKRMEKGK